jgi:hypothetical protein
MSDEFAAELTVSKLSRLQRWMLAQAYHNRTAEGQAGRKGGADLYHGEVLAGFYGFRYQHPRNPEMDNRRFLAGGPHFRPKVIGRARYNAANAAVSRAARRLWARGLADWMQATISHWAGINLTEAGLRVAVTEAAAKGKKGSPEVHKDD